MNFFLRRICFFMAVVSQGGLSFLIEIILLGIVSLAMSVIVCLILHVMESIYVGVGALTNDIIQE
jgi:hypothetical protein